MCLSISPMTPYNTFSSTVGPRKIRIYKQTILHLNSLAFWYFKAAGHEDLHFNAQLSMASQSSLDPYTPTIILLVHAPRETGFAGKQTIWSVEYEDRFETTKVIVERWKIVGYKLRISLHREQLESVHPIYPPYLGHVSHEYLRRLSKQCHNYLHPQLNSFQSKASVFHKPQQVLVRLLWHNLHPVGITQHAVAQTIVDLS